MCFTPNSEKEARAYRERSLREAVEELLRYSPTTGVPYRNQEERIAKRCKIAVSTAKRVIESIRRGDAEKTDVKERSKIRKNLRVVMPKKDLLHIGDTVKTVKGCRMRGVKFQGEIIGFSFWRNYVAANVRKITRSSKYSKNTVQCLLKNLVLVKRGKRK